MKSIDPRVKRLPKVGQPGVAGPCPPLDQLGTFEVFVQPRDGKPFQHEGIVHAPDRDMAWVLAKEAFTRRFSCTSLCVVDTRCIVASPTTEGDSNAYDLVPDRDLARHNTEPFEVYHLLKRGKQHVHAGTVMAANAADAMACAKTQFGNTRVFNVWTIRTADIRFTSAEEKDIWLTLPEKKFRDASEYKGGDRLKELLERLHR